MLLSKRYTFKKFLLDVDVLFQKRKDMYKSHLGFPYQSMNLSTSLLNLFEISEKKKFFFEKVLVIIFIIFLVSCDKYINKYF